MLALELVNWNMQISLDLLFLVYLSLHFIFVCEFLNHFFEREVCAFCMVFQDVVGLHLSFGLLHFLVSYWRLVHEVLLIVRQAIDEVLLQFLSENAFEEGAFIRVDERRLIWLWVVDRRGLEEFS